MKDNLDNQPFSSKFIEIDNANMHYLEAGHGDPILFLHGVPTSSYLWRNIIPHLMPLGRCIAPDLIGFGQSDKPNIQYSIFDHIKYIEKFIETLGLKNITIIMHGLGSIIGFDYAMRHEKNCKGLVFYEAFLNSLNEADLSLPFQEQLVALQTEALDCETNGIPFVDKMISQNMMRELANKEMENYRKPFIEKGTSQPIIQYLKELTNKEDVSKIDHCIQYYSKKLTQSQLPKLMLYSVPGFMTTITTIMWAKENLPQLEILEIGEELHLAQESHPDLIGKMISAWLQGIEATQL